MEVLGDVARGRAAYDRGDWPEAYDAWAGADLAGLTVADLDDLATAAELLGDETAASPFANGGFANVYLSPRDYHRVHMPWTGTLRETLHVPGRVGQDGGDSIDADWDVVSAGYFSTLELRIVQGRPFTSQDRSTAPRVAIVNERMAADAWPSALSRAIAAATERSRQLAG